MADMEITTTKAHNGLMTRKEVAKYLSITENTLAKWAKKNLHFTIMKLNNRMVRYKVNEVEEFVKKHSMSSQDADKT